MNVKVLLSCILGSKSLTDMKCSRTQKWKALWSNSTPTASLVFLNQRNNKQEMVLMKVTDLGVLFFRQQFASTMKCRTFRI